MFDLGRTVAVSGNTVVDGRPRAQWNSTEFKFVFNRILESWHEPQISSLSCQTSKMRTGTTERSAAEFWLIPMECGWVKRKNKEQGIEKDKRRKGQ